MRMEKIQKVITSAFRIRFNIRFKKLNKIKKNKKKQNYNKNSLKFK